MTRHISVRAKLDRGVRKLITTDWVLTEVADAMSGAGSRRAFLSYLRALRADRGAVIVRADREGFDAGLNLYSRRLDKAWSLTDCISFVVMEEHKIVEALTGDHHFEQAGFVALLK